MQIKKNSNRDQLNNNNYNNHNNNNNNNYKFSLLIIFEIFIIFQKKIFALLFASYNR